MQHTINDLVQLQELTEARAQREASMPRAQLTDLDDAIALLQAALPPEAGRRFARLQQRVHLAIVPVAEGVCTGCGMRLPVALAHGVRAAEVLHACPNCARLLYSPAVDRPRRVPGRVDRQAPAPVGLARFSSPGLMLPGLGATNAEEAIRALSDGMAREHFIDDSERLALAVLRREAVASTAVDHALAFPHVRGVEGGGLVLALGVSRKGFHFTGESTSLTRLVFLMVIPTAASAFYLKLLAGLTQALRLKSARDKLLAADTPEKLYKALLAVTRKTIP